MLYPVELMRYVVGEDGFEPPNPKERIYSAPRLASSHIRPYELPYSF